MIRKIALFISLLFCATAHAAETCPAGQYLNGDTCTACPSGTYKDTSGPEECTPCPLADATTVRTSYPDTYYPYDPVTNTYVRTSDPIRTSYVIPDWAHQGVKVVTGCFSVYKYANVAGLFVVEAVYYDPTTGRYDKNDGNVGYYRANPGYYFDIRFRDTYCSENRYFGMMYQKAIVCPAGYYCAGGEVPRCMDGPYETEWGRTECPAGSYCPAGASAPTACPDGYTSSAGATSINDCYMEIAPGYYWTGSVVEICPAEHACAGGNMPYANRGDAWGGVKCSDATATVYVGMTHCGCPIDPLDGQAGNWARPTGTNETWCWKPASSNSVNIGVNEYTTGTAHCYWNGTNYAIGGINRFTCDSYTITACAAGYYAPTASNKGPINCIPVESGYYSPEGAIGRTACPAGLSTIGYGAGADEVADCGRVLHIGDGELHLRSEKRTSPALHVKIDGATFYGDMSTARKGHLRIKIGDTVYSVYDDSM